MTRELLDLAVRLAAAAREGEDIEVFVARDRSTTVRAQGGEVESVAAAETAGIGVRVIRDRRVGFASAGTLDEGVVAEVLAEARDNAAYAEPDEWAGLATPDGVAPTPLDPWDADLERLAADDKIRLALDLERLTVDHDPRVTGVRTAAYGDVLEEAAVATSTGIAVWGRATRCQLSVLALAADGDEVQTGAGVWAGRGPAEADLPASVHAVAADAAGRATRLLGARKVSTRRVALVLEPRTAAAVLGAVARSLTGGAVVKGRSPFADRVGEAIASPLVTLVDDPTDARSVAAEPYDGEGLATRRNVLVGGGVLTGFLLDAYTGRRLGAASTGSAVRGPRSTPVPGVQALAVAPGATPTADLLAAHDGALLVQSMTGLHSGVNTVSGDFSVGVEGLLVRGGELAEPVREVTVASTLQRMLGDVVAVGSEVEWLPSGAGMPPIVIGEVSLSGS